MSAFVHEPVIDATGEGCGRAWAECHQCRWRWPRKHGLTASRAEADDHVLAHNDEFHRGGQIAAPAVVEERDATPPFGIERSARVVRVTE